VIVYNLPVLFIHYFPWLPVFLCDRFFKLDGASGKKQISSKRVQAFKPEPNAPTF
jgi:hypothetical protein